MNYLSWDYSFMRVLQEECDIKYALCTMPAPWNAFCYSTGVYPAPQGRRYRSAVPRVPC